MVIPLSSAATLHCFSSLAPAGQGGKGSSPALLILTMEQPFSSINALVLTLFRLAESCIFKWFGYMSYKLIHNAAKSNYEYHIDGHIAYITYDEQNGNMHLTHTIVPEALVGKGLAKILLEDVLQQIKKDHKKAVAQCSYVVKYLEKNPQASEFFV